MTSLNTHNGEGGKSSAIHKLMSLGQDKALSSVSQAGSHVDE